MRLFTFLIAVLFVSPWEVSFAYDIPPPPAKGSAAENEDFRILHVYQDERTPEACAAAESQSIPTAASLFGPRTGILTSAELETVKTKANDLMEKVFELTDPFKDQYQRERPYEVDPTLRPCISMPSGNRAYPSGHAAAGVVMASFLAKKFPKKRARILDQGNQIGVNRLIGGVHHPSDVAAGQSLGRQILKDLDNLLSEGKISK